MQMELPMLLIKSQRNALSDCGAKNGGANGLGGPLHCVAVPRLSAFMNALIFQQTQTVSNHQQGRSHIGGDRRPKACEPDEGEDEE